METRNKWLSAGVVAILFTALAWTAHAQEFGAPPGLGGEAGGPKTPARDAESQVPSPATVEQETPPAPPAEEHGDIEAPTSGRDFDARTHTDRGSEERQFEESPEFEGRAEDERRYESKRDDQSYVPRHERDGRAGLGVSLMRGDRGILVGDVYQGSPAFEAGLRPGDHLVSVDGHGFCDHGDAADAIGRMNPGDRVALGVLRDGRYQTMEAVLATPDEAFAGERMGQGDRQFAWREEGREFRGDRATDRSEEMARSQFERRRVMRPELEGDSQRDQIQQENDSLRAKVESLEQEVKQLREQLNRSEQATPQKQPNATGAIDREPPQPQEAAPTPSAPEGSP